MEDLPRPDEEEDEENGMPGVTRAPQVRARRKNTTLQSSPTQQEKATGKDAFADLKSKDSTDFRHLSDRLDADESNGEEELYTDSLTSHNTASDSATIGKLSSPLGPITSTVEDPNTVSQTVSQFSSNMPYLEETIQSDNTSTSNNTSTEDSVFPSQSSNVDDTQQTSPTPPIPRSTRSTRGHPSERYGQVYIFETIINTTPEFPRYRQTMYIPCYDYCYSTSEL